MRCNVLLNSIEIKDILCETPCTLFLCGKEKKLHNKSANIFFTAEAQSTRSFTGNFQNEYRNVCIKGIYLFIPNDRSRKTVRDFYGFLIFNPVFSFNQCLKFQEAFFVLSSSLFLTSVYFVSR
ncbi:MAG: hypothetical protein JWM28_3183 [Chitinophagaceae bacterium]|nr:hypothetical protein [Chitinophagaceae bacterium]